MRFKRSDRGRVALSVPFLKENRLIFSSKTRFPSVLKIATASDEASKTKFSKNSNALGSKDVGRGEMKKPDGLSIDTCVTPCRKTVTSVLPSRFCAIARKVGSDGGKSFA